MSEKDGFERLGLTTTPTMKEAFKSYKIESPTEVQAQGIPAILKGQGALLHAGTGTGKTLAYLLPLLQELAADRTQRAVVFAPGAELAMQAYRVAQAFKEEEVTLASAVATTSRRRQKKRVTKSTQLVFGTPARLLELFAGGKLKKVTRVVIDELEPILNSKSAPGLIKLLSRSEPKVQLIIASATLGEQSQKFISRFLPEDSLVVKVNKSPLLQAIRHLYVQVQQERYLQAAVVRFAEENAVKQAIVFVSDPAKLSYLYHYLLDRNLRPVSLSKERTKQSRQRALDAFRKGEARFLLTTDALARGLDVKGVKWVFHLDLPKTVQAYVHRAGRTGRAGEKGVSVVFINRRDKRLLRAIEDDTGVVFSSEG